MKTLLAIKSLLSLKVVLMGVMVMAVAGGLIGGGLFAYFSDTETSTGNTFTAGTIDIAVDGENPWSRSYKVMYPYADCDPEQDPYCDEYLKPSQYGYIEFEIENVGTNPVNVWKRVSITGFDTGLLMYGCGPNTLSSEPECEAEGAEWTVAPVADEAECIALAQGGYYQYYPGPPPMCGFWDTTEWEAYDDISEEMTYDIMSDECYIDEYDQVPFLALAGHWESAGVYLIPAYELHPPIVDQATCEDPPYSGTYYDPTPLEPGSGDETCTLSADVWIDGLWMYLGEILPGDEYYPGYMWVQQSYHLAEYYEPQNYFQGDRLYFEIELYAQQITGDIGAPGPEYIGCQYYGGP